ncbi:MAG: hypothetical protein V1754_08470 [Pseudomonadota bacterium]
MRLKWLAVFALLVGCSDGGEGPIPDPCLGQTGLADPSCQLLVPDKAPALEKGKADFSCVGSAPQPAQPEKDLIIRGKTNQRLSNGEDEPKGKVKVEVWVNQGDLSEKNKIDEDTSDASGNYEVTIPASAWTSASSNGARVAWKISSDDTIPTIEYNDYLDTDSAKEEGENFVLEDQKRITITRSTQQILLAVLGVEVEFDNTKGIILGTVRDCDRKETANVSAGVVDGKGEPIKGPLLFYFSNEFPVARDEQQFTSEDGKFVILNVPSSSSVDTRIIGLVDNKETLLSRHLVATEADTIAIVDFDPLSEPFTD